MNKLDIHELTLWAYTGPNSYALYKGNLKFNKVHDLIDDSYFAADKVPKKRNTLTIIRSSQI